MDEGLELLGPSQRDRATKSKARRLRVHPRTLTEAQHKGFDMPARCQKVGASAAAHAFGCTRIFFPAVYSSRDGRKLSA